MSGEQVTFEFKDGELYIDDVLFKDFSNTLWNDLVLNKKVNDDVNDVVIEYQKIITEVKQYAIPYEALGIEIIKEITRVCVKHLEFVIKIVKKQSKSLKRLKIQNKTNETSSGLNAFCVNKDTMDFVCLSCGLKKKKLLKCSKCLLAYYCDTNCQKNDWKTHKNYCFKS